MTTGAPIAGGKTKIIYADPLNPHLVTIQSKDDLTAGDGAKHDVMAGKAVMANQTTCNNFRFLSKCGVESAFLQQLGDTAFQAVKCDMIPLEVVTRREAHGSFLKREPQLHKGHLFPRLRVEFYLKTAGGMWRAQPLQKDDPYMLLSEDGLAHLYRPDQPFVGAQSFLTISDAPLDADPAKYAELDGVARHVFLALEKAWQLQGRRLVDMKIEFGIGPSGKIMLADVIDNDSWRVLEEGQYIDKQVYRDGGALEAVSSRHKKVMQLTGQFQCPPQQIIIWRGSESDNVDLYPETFYSIVNDWSCRLEFVACSMHKNPERGLEQLRNMLQERPDSVVIAHIGRSNGAGPTIAAHTNVPVITVPASYREFPNDVWSSLRTPSDVPVMTVLEPKNATFAAIRILGQRNPALYAPIRLRTEDHWA